LAARTTTRAIPLLSAGRRSAVPNRASDEVLLAGILLARIERWLEQEGVFHVAGFGDVALAGELDWEPGAGPVYLRRLAHGQLWRADINITARPAEPGEPDTHWRGAT
jgi:hypothetical protein